MKPDYEQLLAEQIDRELKRLPDVKAPERLHGNVMAQVRRRSTQRGWAGWPLLARLVVLCALSAGFGAVCYAAWMFGHAAVLPRVTAQLGALAEPLVRVFSLLETLVSALILSFSRLHTLVLAGIACGCALTYFFWISVGTLWFRLAFSSHQTSLSYEENR